MRKLIFTSIALLIGAIPLLSQITILNSDMPSAGDTIRISIGFDPLFYDYTDTGENHSWDFSELQPFYQNIDTFMTVLETPLIFWPFFLTSSNLVLKSDNFSTVLPIPIGDSYQFFSKTSSVFSDVGLGLEINGLHLPLKYDNPDVWYRFPLEYGSTDSGETGLEFELEDIGYLLVERERSTEVDGWGNLTTPFGTFETLRLKSVVNEFDSIYIDSIGEGFSVYRTYTEYKWLGKNMGLPLLQVVVDDMLGTVITYQDSVRDLNVAIPEIDISGANGIQVYPNPNSGAFTISKDQKIWHRDLNLKLFSLAGQLIWEEKWRVSNVETANILHVNKNSPPGLYLLQVSDGIQQSSIKISIIP